MQQDFWVLASALLKLVVINLEKDQSTWLLIFSKNIYLLGKKWRKGGQLSLTRVGVWLNWKDGQEFIVIIMIIHGIQTGKGKKWECEMMGMENHSFLSTWLNNCWHWRWRKGRSRGDTCQKDRNLTFEIFFFSCDIFISDVKVQSYGIGHE